MNRAERAIQRDRMRNGARVEDGKARKSEEEAFYHEEGAEEALDEIEEIVEELRGELRNKDTRKARIHDLRASVQKFVDQTDQMDRAFGQAMDEMGV